MITRGHALLDAGAHQRRLHGITVDVWRTFTHALTIDDEEGPNKGQPRPFNARTLAGGYGCFDMRPRRLADLGYMRNIRRGTLAGRVVTVGDFIPSVMTEAKFLFDPDAQHDALLESLRRYDRLAMVAGASRSGSLALYHRLGPDAPQKWLAHQEPSTLSLYRRTNNLF